MRYIALALAACGGSSTTTVHGTFKDDADVSGNSTPCADHESLLEVSQRTAAAMGAALDASLASP